MAGDLREAAEPRDDETDDADADEYRAEDRSDTPGWVGLTVAGSLIHLLALLARVRNLSATVPAPSPARDRALATLAAAAIVTWTLAARPVLASLDGVALVLRVGVTLALGTHIAVLALRAAAAPRRGPRAA